MSVVDVSSTSTELFITGVVFILLIGSFLSLGVLRLFQLRKRQGFTYLGLSVVSFLVLLWVIQTFFTE